MNLKNRLKKLESLFITEKPNFCACFDLELKRIITQIYNGDFSQEHNFSFTSQISGEVCAECRKPIQTHIREINQNLQEIYG